MDLNPDQIKSIATIVIETLNNQPHPWELYGGSTVGGIGSVIVAWRVFYKWRMGQEEVRTKDREAARKCLIDKLDGHADAQKEAMKELSQTYVELAKTQAEKFDVLTTLQTKSNASLLATINVNNSEITNRSMKCQNDFHDKINGVDKRTTTLEAKCENVNGKLDHIEKVVDDTLKDAVQLAAG